MQEYCFRRKDCTESQIERLYDDRYDVRLGKERNARELHQLFGESGGVIRQRKHCIFQTINRNERSAYARDISTFASNKTQVSA